MSLTHEEARQLIQFKADRALSTQDRSALEAHLAICQACTTYAGQIKSMELNLRQVFKRQWNATPLPLHAAEVQNSMGQRGSSRAVSMRRLLAGVVTMLFAFTIWQFALTGKEINSLPVAEVSPNASASITTSTGTQNSLLACDQLQYRVHSGDTLASIAERFSISPEALTELNHLDKDELDQGAHIIIPLCTLTPASTDRAPEPTLTPGFQTFTTTPG